MKALLLVIAFPMLSVLILSLAVQTGVVRWVALGLLAGTVLAALIILLRRRDPHPVPDPGKD